MDPIQRNQSCQLVPVPLPLWNLVTGMIQSKDHSNIKCISFDPHQIQHINTNIDVVNKFLEKSIPSTGSQQFWRSKMSDESAHYPFPTA